MDQPRTCASRNGHQKNELLIRYGINFNDFLHWQKRGVGLGWEEYDKRPVNWMIGAEVFARHRRIRIDYDLPMKDEYDEFVCMIVMLK